MSAPETPREVVDLDALAATIADSLQEATYCLAGQVGGGDGFVTFETSQTVVTNVLGVLTSTVRATVDMVSDGEDPVEGAAGEVFEIVVRRVTR